MSYSILDTAEPLKDTMKLVEEYVAGNIEIADALETVIEKSLSMGLQNIWFVCNFEDGCFEKLLRCN